MPKIKRGKRPFRGAAEGKVYQTLDVGAGKGRRIAKQAAKFPNRKYAIADFAARPIGKKNVRVFQKAADRALDKAAEEGLKFRHVNMDMPAGDLLDAKYVKGMLRKLKKVLLPNGKIFISTNDVPHWAGMRKIFEEEGFALSKKARKVRFGEYTDSMHGVESSAGKFDNRPGLHNFWRFSATFTLKEARRQRLPEVKEFERKN